MVIERTGERSPDSLLEEIALAAENEFAIPSSPPPGPALRSSIEECMDDDLPAFISPDTLSDTDAIYRPDASDEELAMSTSTEENTQTETDADAHMPSFHTSELRETSSPEVDWEAEDDDEEDDDIISESEDTEAGDDMGTQMEHESQRYIDATQEPFSPDLLDSRELSNRYAKALHDEGYTAVIKRVWEDEERTGHRTFKADDQTLFWKTAIRVLASTQTCLINEIIAGNIARAYRHDAKIREVLEGNERRWRTRQPCVYQQILVDGNGDSPSATQVLEMVDYRRRYMTDDAQLANAIDNAVGGPGISLARSAAGFRRYLEMKNDERPSHKKVKQLRRFCTNLEQWCQDVPEAEKDQALQRPLAEFGYTNNPKVRFADHKAHRKSNYLMNATEAVCRLHYPEFSIERYVIYYIWSSEQASVAEVLFHDLGGGYIHMGSGFSHFPAGKSVHSVMGVDEALWTQWTNEAAEFSPVLANMRNETQRIRASGSGADEINAEVVRLRARKAELEGQLERAKEDKRNREEEELRRMRDYRDNLEAVIRLLKERDERLQRGRDGWRLRVKVGCLMRSHS